MTGLYVYGITARPVRTLTRGIFGRPLRVVKAGPVHALVETAARAPKPTVRNLRAQNRVVAALVVNRVDVLPVRFGTFVSEETELRRLIDSREFDLVRALRLIKGRVQMTTRLRLGESEPRIDFERQARGRTGTAYLHARANRARQWTGNPLVQAIRRAANPYARDSRLEWREGPPAVVTLHHLVARSRVPQYEEAVLRVVRARGVDATVSGPWAPFAFAEVA